MCQGWFCRASWVVLQVVLEKGEGGFGREGGFDPRLTLE